MKRTGEKKGGGGERKRARKSEEHKNAFNLDKDTLDKTHCEIIYERTQKTLKDSFEAGQSTSIKYQRLEASERAMDEIVKQYRSWETGNKLDVVMVGPVGAGKSYVIKAIIGDDLADGCGLIISTGSTSSVTQITSRFGWSETWTLSVANFTKEAMKEFEEHEEPEDEEQNEREEEELNISSLRAKTFRNREKLKQIESAYKLELVGTGDFETIVAKFRDFPKNRDKNKTLAYLEVLGPWQGLKEIPNFFFWDTPGHEDPYAAKIIRDKADIIALVPGPRISENEILRRCFDFLNDSPNRGRFQQFLLINNCKGKPAPIDFEAQIGRLHCGNEKTLISTLFEEESLQKMRDAIKTVFEDQKVFPNLQGCNRSEYLREITDRLKIMNFWSVEASGPHYSPTLLIKRMRDNLVTVTGHYRLLDILEEAFFFFTTLNHYIRPLNRANRGTVVTKTEVQNKIGARVLEPPYNTIDWKDEFDENLIKSVSELTLKKSNHRHYVHLSGEAVKCLKEYHFSHLANKIAEFRKEKFISLYQIENNLEEDWINDFLDNRPWDPNHSWVLPNPSSDDENGNDEKTQNLLKILDDRLNNFHEKLEKALEIDLCNREKRLYVKEGDWNKMDASERIAKLRKHICKVMSSRKLCWVVFTLNSVNEIYEELFGEDLTSKKIQPKEIVHFCSNIATLAGKVNHPSWRPRPQMITTKTSPLEFTWDPKRYDSTLKTQQLPTTEVTSKNFFLSLNAEDRGVLKLKIEKNVDFGNTGIHIQVCASLDPFQVQVRLSKDLEEFLVIHLQHLEGKIQDENPSCIPIFIPSKKRADIANCLAYSAPDTSSKKNQRSCLEEDTWCSIFLVVESQEVEEYVRNFGEKSKTGNHRVFIVEIPGCDRGIGFARTTITQIVQRALREVLLAREDPIIFDYYAMLDDDIVKFQIYDKSRFSFLPCSANKVLDGLVRIMKTEQAACDGRGKLAKNAVEDCDDKSKDEETLQDKWEEFKKPHRSKAKTLKTIYQASVEDLISASSVNTPEEYFEKCQFFKKVLAEVKSDQHTNLLQDFAEELWKQLRAEQLRSTCRVAMVSAPEHHGLSLYQYNYTTNATHMVSKLHHACTVFYAPAVEGFGHVASGPVIIKPKEEKENPKKRLQEYHNIRPCTVKGLSDTELKERVTVYDKMKKKCAEQVSEYYLPQEGMFLVQFFE
jgi:hypothetical protein